MFILRIFLRTLPRVFVFSIAFHAVSGLAAPRVPWTDGESLRYDVEWGPLTAATGTFTAKSAPGGAWDFAMNLKTLGTVEFIYPIRSGFRSHYEPGPWRSTGFSYARNENDDKSEGSTTVDYRRKSYTHLRTGLAKPEVHSFTQSSLEDLLSALYTMRRVDWLHQDSGRFAIFEKGSIREAEAKVLARHVRELDDEPSEPLTQLEIQATGKGKPLHMTVWMTEDARKIPVRVEVRFRFGTFEVVLKK
jgi:hypothetical protein